MSTFKKKWSAVLVSAICILMMLFAVPAFAADELDSETKETVEYLVTSFLNEVYELPGEELDELRQQGDFYNTLADAIAENEENLGKLISVNSAEATMGSNDHINCVVDATFEKNDAVLTVYLMNDDMLTPTHYQVSIDYSLGDKLKMAAGNTVLSIIIVFVLLIVLAFIISLFRFLNFEERAKMAEKIDTQVEKRAKKEAAQERRAHKEQLSAMENEQAEAARQEEIAAVIAAAVAAAEAESGGDGYVVRSVRKIGTVRNWNRA